MGKFGWFPVKIFPQVNPLKGETRHRKQPNLKDGLPRIWKECVKLSQTAAEVLPYMRHPQLNRVQLDVNQLG